MANFNENFDWDYKNNKIKKTVIKQHIQSILFERWKNRNNFPIEKTDNYWRYHKNMTIIWLIFGNKKNKTFKKISVNIKMKTDDIFYYYLL